MNWQAELRVIHAGPLVSVQDGGRRGMMRFGVPASGPMDRKALAIANVAVGNDPGAAGIEVSEGGLVLETITGGVTLAVVGGGFAVSVDGVALPSWSVFTLHLGQRLTLRPGVWGRWACIAVAGRLERPTWLGSFATHVLSDLGGGAVAAGQVLRIANAEHRDARLDEIPVPDFARPRSLLHVTIGPQDRYFSKASIEALLGQPFRLTDAADRMGIRLSGPPLRPESALGIPSEPVSRGSVQVSGDGVATILLADHQTTGGYPKIATVVTDDLDGFVQMRAGDEFRFQDVTAEGALHLARKRAVELAAYLSMLTGPRTTFEQRLSSENLIGGVVGEANDS